MRTIIVAVGMSERKITEKEVRNAQAALLKDNLGENDKALIDAIISHFACGRPTKWNT